MPTRKWREGHQVGGLLPRYNAAEHAHKRVAAEEKHRLQPCTAKWHRMMNLSKTELRNASALPRLMEAIEVSADVHVLSLPTCMHLHSVHTREMLPGGAD